MSHAELAGLYLICGLLFILLPEPFYAAWQARKKVEWGLADSVVDELRWRIAASRVMGTLTIIAGLWEGDLGLFG